MTVHRIYVRSEDRLSGHRGDFVIDTSKEFARFDGRRVMCGVEFTDVIRYSKTASYSKNDENPTGLLLESPDLIASNSYQSWDGNTSPVLALLQNHGQAGLFGLCHDLPYMRKSHMGVLVDYDYVKRLGTMRFRLRRCNDLYNIGDRELVEENDNIEAFAFQLVFWEPCSCTMFSPFSYDFFRVWLSAESGSTNDCRIPVLLNTCRSVDTSEGKWFVALEYHSPLFSTALQSEQPGSIALACPTLVGSEDNHIIGHFGKSERTGEEGCYGQRYSIKPLSRDVIGHELRVNIDRLTHIHLRLVDPTTMTLLQGSDYGPSYVLSFVFYRVK